MKPSDNGEINRYDTLHLQITSDKKDVDYRTLSNVIIVLLLTLVQNISEDL